METALYCDSICCSQSKFALFFGVSEKYYSTCCCPIKYNTGQNYSLDNCVINKSTVDEYQTSQAFFSHLSARISSTIGQCCSTHLQSFTILPINNRTKLYSICPQL